MKRLLHISFLYMAAALLSACTDSLTEPQPQPSPDARELAGIRAEIAGTTDNGFTRAGTVTPPPGRLCGPQRVH